MKYLLKKSKETTAHPTINLSIMMITYLHDLLNRDQNFEELHGEHSNELD